MRLIDADALMETIRTHEYMLATKSGSVDYGMFTLGIQQAADEQPTIEARPVVRGEWIEYDCFRCNSDGDPVIKTGSIFVCSICGREEQYKEPFCNCGAEMRGDDDEAD